MDPNETLAELREWAQHKLGNRISARRHLEGWEVAERFEALDEWLSKGGFLPSDWSRVPGPGSDDPTAHR